MNRSKLDSYLGFAARSRNLVTGYNTCLLLMGKKRIKFIILAEDLSENTLEKMVSQCKKHNVKYKIFGDSDQLSKTTGNSGKGIFGITNSKFSKIICEEIDRIQSEREVF